MTNDGKREDDHVPKATAPGLGGMALKVGVMGGATGVPSKEHLDKAHELGRAIAENGVILITGGCGGLPLAAACGAKQEGGLVVGISPGLSLDEQVRTRFGWNVQVAQDGATVPLRG